MRAPAVFVRRCVACHLELQGLDCPNAHPDALGGVGRGNNQEGGWEVFDVTRGVIVATVVGVVSKGRGGVPICSSKVVWTAEAEAWFSTKGPLDGRDADGFTPDLTDAHLRRLNDNRRSPQLEGRRIHRVVSERWQDTSGFCPDCGAWLRCLENHPPYCTGKVGDVAS